ncbi:MAG: hypothetical protein ACPGSB_07515 [Opitutales bacterium]
MDTKTTYLGLELEHPLMAGSSPLAHDIDSLLRWIEAGASSYERANYVYILQAWDEKVQSGKGLE